MPWQMRMGSSVHSIDIWVRVERPWISKKMNSRYDFYRGSEHPLWMDREQLEPSQQISKIPGQDIQSQTFTEPWAVFWKFLP